MHDVPKRTEDIFILCINFYPAVEIHRRLCTLPKTSTLHDYDYVTFFYVTQLEHTQRESMAGSTAYNSLCHTRSTQLTAGCREKATAEEETQERRWSEWQLYILVRLICRLFVERSRNIHMQQPAQPAQRVIPLRMFWLTLTNCAFDFSFLSFVCSVVSSCQAYACIRAFDAWFVGNRVLYHHHHHHSHLSSEHIFRSMLTQIQQIILQSSKNEKRFNIKHARCDGAVAAATTIVSAVTAVTAAVSALTACCYCFLCISTERQHILLFNILCCI